MNGNTAAPPISLNPPLCSHSLGTLIEWKPIKTTSVLLKFISIAPHL
ncbi:MAG: hypothetical protein O1I36_17605 [Cylindrospermopsis raciborskii PAMP2011]|nr:hypothetical protein [Cylindrospermopsis raciborskii PAMP2011]